ncbi:MAG: hypothetical protein ACJ8AT_05675 [Hyalangium sp.]|uniref:nSTAND1 domain-containing NTPase n=1 Tax=Hyalangium sp. TaxID=2028555 RepID=UPI00389A3897
MEIVHESLIHSWPTLRRWLDEGQEDTAFLEQLRVAARQWQAKERDSDLLWRGELVEEAQRFQRRYRGELPRMQQDFLAAVFALAARDTRRKRTLAVGAMVFLGLLVAASSVALLIIRESKQEAVRQKQEAVRQAEAAQLAEAEQRKAKDEAERNLAEAQAKEQQRREALENAVRAKAEAESAKERLSAALLQENAALRKSKRDEIRAKKEKIRADKSAEELRREVEEKEKRLKKALGESSLIEVLNGGTR